MAAAIDGDARATSADPELATPREWHMLFERQDPAGPRGQATKCPNGYELHSGSPMIGVDRPTTYNQSVTTDYLGKALPHATGTSWNIGADGATH